MANASELVVLGSKIAEIGEKLKELRGRRKVVEQEIEEAETELRPLLVRHTTLLAEIMGEVLPSPPTPLPSVQRTGDGEKPGGLSVEANPAKERVRAFLKTVAPGTWVSDIADAIKIDAALVREVMREMAQTPAREAESE